MTDNNSVNYKAAMFDKLVKDITTSIYFERLRAKRTTDYYDKIKDTPYARNKDMVLRDIEDAKSCARAYERILNDIGITLDD